MISRIALCGLPAAPMVYTYAIQPSVTCMGSALPRVVYREPKSNVPFRSSLLLRMPLHKAQRLAEELINTHLNDKINENNNINDDNMPSIYSSHHYNAQFIHYGVILGAGENSYSSNQTSDTRANYITSSKDNNSERKKEKQWSFAFDGAKRRFGCCRYRSRVISLSRHLTAANTPRTVRDVILHEIAHALAPGDGHGKKWKEQCALLGILPNRCYDHNKVKMSHPKYYLTCGQCGWAVAKMRKVLLKRPRRHYWLYAML